MSKVNVRNDDFDGRMRLPVVKDTHEKILKHGLTEIIGVNCQKVKSVVMDSEVCEYVRGQEGYEFAVHGFEHSDLTKLSYIELVKDFAASAYFIYKWFGSFPKYYCGPWNMINDEIRRACETVGIEPLGLAVDIKAYVKDYPKFVEYDSVFFHMWDKDVLPMLDNLFKRIKEYDVL